MAHTRTHQPSDSDEIASLAMPSHPSFRASEGDATLSPTAENGERSFSATPKPSDHRPAALIKLVVLVARTVPGIDHGTASVRVRVYQLQLVIRESSPDTAQLSVQTNLKGEARILYIDLRL